MEFQRMRPAQLADAIARSLPVVLPIGVMEYHGGHLPAGVDLLAVTETLARMGDDIVVLPAFAYGAASHAVAGPDGLGTLHVDAAAILPFAEALWTSLLAAGFRNLHGVVHHQSENFAQGMPTDLVFRLAARNAIFRFQEATRGPGWWGSERMQDYYGQTQSGTDPFSWIRIHPLLPTGEPGGPGYPFDHAGEGETGLMQALAPDSVDMRRLGDGSHWYVQGAERASATLGERGVAVALAHLRRCFGLGG